MKMEQFALTDGLVLFKYRQGPFGSRWALKKETVIISGIINNTAYFYAVTFPKTGSRQG
jgi:hypothetical protein